MGQWDVGASGEFGTVETVVKWDREESCGGCDNCDTRFFRGGDWNGLGVCYLRREDWDSWDSWDRGGGYVHNAGLSRWKRMKKRMK